VNWNSDELPANSARTLPQLRRRFAKSDVRRMGVIFKRITHDYFLSCVSIGPCTNRNHLVALAPHHAAKRLLPPNALSNSRPTRLSRANAAAKLAQRCRPASGPSVYPTPVNRVEDMNATCASILISQNQTRKPRPKTLLQALALCKMARQTSGANAEKPSAGVLWIRGCPDTSADFSGLLLPA
jgi:hypothetical protein